jgi:glycosyltransferase involved in cell wall biosynthesis
MSRPDVRGTTPLSLALLHYSFPPVVGGVETVVGRHANLLEEQGHVVRGIAGRGGPWRDGADFRQIALVDSRHEAVLAQKSDLDAGRVPKDFGALVQQLEAELRPALEDVDILVAHNVCSLHKNLALTAALRRIEESHDSPALVLWHHDLAWTSPLYRSELHEGYPWDLLRTAWQGVHQVAVSQLRRSELASLFEIPAEGIRVVPNGVDIPRFLGLEPETQRWMRQLDLLEASPLLLLPARITRRKNIELALRALVVVRQHFPEAGLLVTGPLGAHNSRNEDYFRQLASLRDQLGLHRSAILLAGFAHHPVPDVVIADFYQLADAILIPSLEEGFGIPLLEAAITHRPVFCSDLPSLRELGQSDVHYFPANADPQAVGELIVDHFRDDPTFRFAARVRREYSWSSIYRHHLGPLLLEVDAARRGKGGAP